MLIKKLRMITVWVVMITLISTMFTPVHLHAADEDYVYDDNGDGTAAITGYTGKSKEIAIPKTIDNLTVTSVVYDAFKNKQLMSVAIPDSVISIGDRAFSSNMLTSVVIPSSVTSIGDSAFSMNILLNTVVMHNESVSIGNDAFNSFDLTIIGHDPSTAKDYADENGYIFIDIKTAPEKDYEWITSSLRATITNYKGSEQNIVIPNKLAGVMVTGIESDAFRGKNLSRVTIPQSVASIGASAFADNQANPTDLIIVGYDPSVAKDYALANGHTFEDIFARDYDWTKNGDGSATITKYKGTSKDVVIPQAIGGLAITKIDKLAFYNMQLTSVTIPYGVTSIGDNAFRDNLLTSITIPSSVTSIGNIAFYHNQISTLTLGNGLKSIGASAFSYNSLTELIIPESVTSIGADAFMHNDLSSITLPESVANIGNASFSWNKLKLAVIYNDSLTIGSNAFAYNQPYPSMLTIIGHDPSTAKMYADDKEHTFKNINTAPETQYEWIDHLNGTATIAKYVGSDTVIVLPEMIAGLQVTVIGSYSFRDKQITKIVVKHDSVTFGTDVFADNQRSPADLTIIGYDPSTAKTYAEAKAHRFIDITTLPENNYDWKNNGDGTATITKYRGTSKAIVIPNELDGLTVTGIGDVAFYGKGLTNVVIPNNVTSIGDNAFDTNNLTNITIPASVLTIGDYAFAFNQLTDAIISEGVTSIGKAAFTKNQLSSVTIPTSITSVGSFAFNTNKINKLIISEGVQSIGQAAFTENQLGSVVIPSSVTNIAAGAFARNNITRVVIFNRQINIDSNDVFYNNQSNPADLTIIGYNGSTSEAFAKTNRYTFIPELDYDWQDNGDGTASLTVYKGISKDIVIPNKLGGFHVVSIGDSAFADMQLTNITIPNSVTMIENAAFRGNHLTKIIIPAGVMNLGDQAFYDNQLTSATILNNSITFGDDVFDNNQPNSEDIILVGSRGSTTEKYAYDNRHTFIDELDYDLRDNGDGTAAIKKYKGTATDVVIPHALNGLTITGIGDSSFSGKGLTNVVIPNSVITIGKSSFSNNQLLNISIPDSVITVEDSAFSGNQLTKVDIPNSVISIGEAVFASNKLTTFHIPDRVTTIEKNTFWGNQLSAVTIPDSVTKIGEGAFSFNDLTHIVIPNSVVELEKQVFYGRNKLNIVTILNRDIVIHDDAFYGTYTFPSGLTIVGYSGSTAEAHASNKRFTFKKFAPDLQVVHITDTTISLSWDELPFVNEYVLMRDGDEVYRGIDTSFADIGLKPVTEYEYSIIGIFNGGNSEAAMLTIKTDVPIPDEPALQINNISETTISLAWNHVPFADEYIVKRDGMEVYRGTDTTFADTGLNPLTSYAYSIVATNVNGASNEAIVTIKTNPPIPAMPKLLIDDTQESIIKLSWNSVQHADEYIVKRDGVEVYRGTSSSFIDKGLDSDTEYSYSLVATNVSGSSVEFKVTVRTKSSDASLSKLTISEGTLVPVFHSDTLDYSASVENQVGSITVTPIASSSKATVTINSQVVTSGSASNSLKLEIGVNTIIIEVIAENEIKKTYTITVTRKSASSGGGGGEGGGSVPVPVPDPKEPMDMSDDEDMNAETERTVPQLFDITGHWAEANIRELVNLGVITGYPNGTFLPDHHITRAEFVTMLVKAFGLVAKEGKIFADTTHHWAKESIAIAEAHGIVSGYNETTFGADGYITREQMAVMIARAMNLQVNRVSVEFIDSTDVSPWAANAITATFQAGIITGYPDHSFKPQGNASRAEAVTVLLRALVQP